MEKIGDESCFKMRIIEYHDYKTLMGPCFVSFSLPLLIPGVVLTVVGSYGNEHTFSRFGGWHISGIVILSFATIMLIAGILLKCCFKPVLSADIEQHLSPQSSVITGSKNLGYERDKGEGDKESQRGGSNKVSPLHQAGKHNVVSTHERRQRKTSEKAVTNGAIGAAATDKRSDQRTSKAHENTATKHKTFDADSGEIETAKTIHVQQGVAHKNVSDSESEHSDRLRSENVPVPQTDRGPPPPYDDTHHRQLRKKRSDIEAPVLPNEQTLSFSTETPSGAIKTTVTSSVNAEVTSQYRNGASQRDNSSDANEDSRFLPDIQKKPKKKRKKRPKRRPSEMTEYEADIEDSPKPEQHLKPVLLHEGEHHHHDLHVHFQNGSQNSSHQDIKGEGQPNVSITGDDSYDPTLTHGLKSANSGTGNAQDEAVGGDGRDHNNAEEDSQMQTCDINPPDAAKYTYNEFYV